MNDPLLSDDLLLSLMWAVPLAGSLITLVIPKKAEMRSRGSPRRDDRPRAARRACLHSLHRRRLEGRRRAAPDPHREQCDPLRGANGPADSAPGDLIVPRPWIPSFHIQYYLGLDGISLSLILLTGLVSVLSCLASFSIDKQVKGYFSLFLLLTSSMMGVFLALDMFLFYVFFEVMLLPMYFLIAIWGGENREYAAIKFLLYTLFGSVFILTAILISTSGRATPAATSWRARRPRSRPTRSTR